MSIAFLRFLTLSLSLATSMTFVACAAQVDDDDEDSDEDDDDDDDGDTGEGEGEGEGEGGGEGEGEGESGWTCDATFFAADDGCDCGCNIADPDCPSSDASACTYNNCPGGAPLNDNDPTQCSEPPEGWTCAFSTYADGFNCDCGCGVADPDCPANPTRDDCAFHGCGETQRPDDADVTTCVANPAGWTCDGLSFGDGFCHCGCGIVDEDCASDAFQECQGDGCVAGESPDPREPTTCIDNAPQDSWTCDQALLFDGAVCDCGCGAVDPDCDSATAAACDEAHCGFNEELVPGDVTACQEICDATTTAEGDGTCTNGGSVSFGSACNHHLSACGDGHSYEVECDGSGTCVCRVDGACISRGEGFCGSTDGTLNSVCGWSLFDAT